jgi:hypothetical protein
MRIIERTNRTINLSGIDDHTVRNLTIVTAGGVVRTQKGNVVLVVHQTADMTRDSKTILSCGQMEDFGCTVNEKPKRISGRTPFIKTIEGYSIPISIRDGLPYIRMRPFRDNDWDSLPHVSITSPASWEPSIMDAKVKDKWYQEQEEVLEGVAASPFDEFGNLKDDPEDDGDENFEDQNHQAIDRGTVRAHFSSLITEEIGGGYIICEADGHIYDIDYDSDEHGEYYGSNKTITCFPTRRSTRSSTKRATEKSIKKAPLKSKPRPKPKATRTSRKEPRKGEDSETEAPDLLERKGTSSDSSDDGRPDSSSEDEVRTDCNNPARTMNVPGYLARPTKRNIERYTRYFPGSSIDAIKKTFKATTQLGTRGAVKGMTLRNRIIAPNPILNIPRRNEDVATDTIYGKVPAVDCGVTAAQYFIGRRSQFRAITPLGTSYNHPSWNLG